MLILSTGALLLALAIVIVPRCGVSEGSRCERAQSLDGGGNLGRDGRRIRVLCFQGGTVGCKNSADDQYIATRQFARGRRLSPGPGR